MFSHHCVCLSPRTTTRKSHFIHRASNHSWHNFHTQASKRRQSYDHYCGNRVAVTLSTLCGSTQQHTHLHKVSTWSNSIPHSNPKYFQGYPSFLAMIVISRKSIENLVLLSRKIPEEYWIAVSNTSIIYIAEMYPQCKEGLFDGIVKTRYKKFYWNFTHESSKRDTAVV